MNNSVIKVLCQVYLLLVLLAVATMLLPLYSYLALFLLLAVLLTIFGRLPAGFNIAVTTVVIFLLPLVIRPLLDYPLTLQLLVDYPLVSEPLLHYLSYTALPPLILLPLAAVIAALPTLYLLDYHLRRNAPTTLLAPAAVGRRVTPVFRALLTAALVMLLLSFFIGNGILLFTAAVLVLYLVAVLIRVLQAILGQPVAVSTTGRRIIAGSTAAISLDARSRAPVGLHCLISPVDPWLKVTPHRFTLNGDGVELNLTVTPPLAGPSYPRLRLSLTDPRGLFQAEQVIEPVALEVIPRAKYAYWLAMKFLEQTGSRGTGAGELSAPEYLPPRRGVEYSDSREYQPGDRLKDIDWKHSLKLGQLIVKEYIEVGGQAAIIAANLAVSDAEEADKLAFKLITTALTLAKESIPTALAVYNREGVVVTTAATDPREILKETLSLVKEITPVEFAHRFLETPNIRRLRQSIARLEPVTSGPAQRLLDILNFEYRAIEEAARDHPATRALSLAAGRLPPPAVIILVSQLNHDTEALMVATEKLSRRGFTTLPLEVLH